VLILETPEAGAIEGVGDIIKKVAESSGKGEDEIKKLIDEKQDELSGLVSEEGAAYIVARELGVNLLKATNRRLKVKNLIPGLRSVDLMARVVRVFEPREWSRGDKSGKVASVILGDDTGTIRLSLWNDEVKTVLTGAFVEGDTIKVSGGHVKMDNRGQPDLRLGRGSIEKVEDKSIELPMPDQISATSASQRRDIKDFKEGDYGECMAGLVQIFKRSRPFYEVCPQCGNRVAEKEGKYECQEHGQVEPDYRMVLSGVIDDGTANMRVVFFGETAEKVLGKSVKELRDDLSKGKNQEEIYEKCQSVGKDFMFKGRIKRNDLSGNLEMVANEVSDFDVKAEIRRLLEQVKN